MADELNARLRLRLEEAEKRAREAEQHALREQRRAEKAEEQTRRTTLDEYIAATHDLVFVHLTVETDKELTSRGSLTNPRNKLCPTQLRPWTDFLEQQRIVLGHLYDTFPLPTDFSSP
jgi:hypothetical protein